MAFGTPTTLGSTANGSANTVYTHTTTAAAPAGSRVFLAAYWVSNSAPPLYGRVTDNGAGGSLEWSQIAKLGEVVMDGLPYTLCLFSAYAPAGLASGTVLTLNLTGGPNSFGVNLGAFYLTGVRGQGFVDMVDGASDPGPVNTAWDTTASPTSEANTMLLGIAAADGLGAAGNGVPVGTFTELLDFYQAGNDWGMVVAYREVASQGSYGFTGNWSATPAFNRMDIIVALKPGEAVPGLVHAAKPMRKRR